MLRCTHRCTGPQNLRGLAQSCIKTNRTRHTDTQTHTPSFHDCVCFLLHALRPHTRSCTYAGMQTEISRGPSQLLACLRPWGRGCCGPPSLWGLASHSPVTQTHPVCWCVTGYNHSRHGVAGVFSEVGASQENFLVEVSLNDHH